MSTGGFHCLACSQITPDGECHCLKIARLNSAAGEDKARREAQREDDATDGREIDRTVRPLADSNDPALRRLSPAWQRAINEWDEQ
jgi:hypothetical protein